MNNKLYPALSKIKNEAKKLKESSDLSLMQAQNIIAKKKGYNSWHDLLQKIKNVFCEEKKSHHSKNLTSNNINQIPENAYIHIGQDSLSGKEQWLSYSTSRCHMNIFEEKSSIHSMDVYLAKQNILKNRPLIYTSSNTEITNHLMDLAIKNKRKIYLFDTNNQLNNYFEYQQSKLSLSHYSESDLTNLFLYYIPENLIEEEKKQFMNFLYLANYITIYKNKHEKINISLSSILNNGNLNQFQIYSKIFSKENTQFNIYLNEGIIFLSKDLKYKNLFEELYLTIIEKLKSTNLFLATQHNQEINFDCIYGKQKEYPIFIFLSTKINLNQQNLINKTILNYYYQFVSNILGTPLVSSINMIIDSKNKDSLSKNMLSFIMHEPPLENCENGSFFAQSRAIGASFIFVFNSISNNFLYEFRILLANSFTNFFGKFSNENFIHTIFNQKIGAYLSIQSIYNKKIICDYNINNIINLASNEYIIINDNILQKNIL